jgi:hypothetical protein
VGPAVSQRVWLARFGQFRGTFSQPDGLANQLVRESVAELFFSPILAIIWLRELFGHSVLDML